MLKEKCLMDVAKQGLEGYSAILVWEDNWGWWKKDIRAVIRKLETKHKIKFHFCEAYVSPNQLVVGIKLTR
jgi:hypothetical protein